MVVKLFNFTKNVIQVAKVNRNILNSLLNGYHCMPVGQVMDANRHYTDKNIIKLRQQNYSLRHTIHIIVMYSVLYVSHVITILETK